ncbi:hypothetical protein L683_20390 [Pseudomonas aeruginosa WC55]|nr:hypothetical protein L683_20390 [Pseudomonas aeruginosa WC55]
MLKNSEASYQNSYNPHYVVLQEINILPFAP